MTPIEQRNTLLTRAILRVLVINIAPLAHFFVILLPYNIGGLVYDFHLTSVAGMYIGSISAVLIIINGWQAKSFWRKAVICYVIGVLIGYLLEYELLTQIKAHSLWNYPPITVEQIILALSFILFPLLIQLGLLPSKRNMYLSLSTAVIAICAFALIISLSFIGFRNLTPFYIYIPAILAVAYSIMENIQVKVRPARQILVLLMIPVITLGICVPISIWQTQRLYWDALLTPREYMELNGVVFEAPDESLYAHTSEEILEYMHSQYNFGEEAKGLAYRVYRKKYSTEELEPMWLVIFLEADVLISGRRADYIYRHIYFYLTPAGSVYSLGNIPEESLELVNPNDPFELGYYD